MGAAAGRHRDLDGVATRLTHVFEVKWFVSGLVVPALDVERRSVDADRDGGGPVGAHVSVLVVETLEL